MEEASRLAEGQRRAPARLSAVPEATELYLASGTAVALHLGHRRSIDLDLFTSKDVPDTERHKRAILVCCPDARLLADGTATSRLELEGVPIDLVAYPYPPLEALEEGPSGIPIASPLDLAVMKLAAIARRGLRRDLWDLKVLVEGPVALRECAQAYTKRYGRAAADLYHVSRALTWFEDAEADDLFPAGLSEAGWEDIKRFWRERARELITES